MTVILTLISKYWISITLFLLTVISILSLLPLPQLPPAPGTDKAHHFIAYGALIFPTALRKPNYGFVIILFLMGWSGAIELLQPYVNRYGELQDMLANIAGLGCGFALAQGIQRFFPLNLNTK